MLISLEGSLIAMLVVGIFLLFVFTAWEFWCAKRPVIPFRFLTNRTFVGATWMCFFDFVSILPLSIRTRSSGIIDVYVPHDHIPILMGHHSQAMVGLPIN